MSYFKHSFADKVVSILGESGTSTTSFTQLTTALNQATKDMLPKRVRNVPPWFKINEEILHAAIHRRNAAFNLAHFGPSVDTRSTYVIARIIFHQMVRNAKSCLIKYKCDAINVGLTSGTSGRDALGFC
jgi:hypothetical protein